jgi:hypothetical protein
MERNSYLLELCLAQPRAPKGADGLLIPLPPDTLYQKFQNVCCPAGWPVQRLTAASASQDALYIRSTAGLFDSPIELQVDVPGAVPDPSHFHDPANRYTDCTSDVDELFHGLALEGQDEAQRVQSIVACLEGRFSYDSAYDGTDEPMALSCDALTGNCLDINTALMKLLTRAGVPCAYYIGYFFEAGFPFEVDDWHCWVSTLGPAGQQDWDIAHHLKRRLAPVRPALNPIPGMRFAMSSGRGLKFLVPAVGAISVSHLGLPRWVMRDGRTEECTVYVTANPCDVSATAAFAIGDRPRADLPLPSL